MKLYVNEKLLSLHRKFYIKDEFDADVYEVSSQFISIGDKTTITDMFGNKISYIEQEILHFMPHYNVYIDDELVLTIQKKFKLFKNDYELSNGYTVEGNFIGLNFSLFDENHQEIGTISRKFISIGDKYTIEINDDSKLKIVLSVMVAIANDINRAQNSNN